MTATVTTIDELLAATNLSPLLYVRMGGVVIDAFEAHTDHGVNQRHGSCSVVCAAPAPDMVELNAEIEVEAGYPGMVARIFHGRVVDIQPEFSDAGPFTRIAALAWSHYLADSDVAGLELPGPISLADVFRSLCSYRSVPAYHSESTTLPDGSDIMLGGNQYVDGGAVGIDNRTAPLQLANRAAELFGYRVYDRPDGELRQSRVSGLPPEGEASPPPFAAGDIVRGTRINEIYSDIGFAFALPPPYWEVGDIAQVIEGPYQLDGPYWYRVYLLPSREVRWLFFHSTVNTTTYGEKIGDVGRPFYSEGVSAFRGSRSRTSRAIVTFWEVEGARYTGEGGIVTQIRSIAEDVPPSAFLSPLQYRHRSVSDRLLVSDQLAAGARNVLEIDHSEPFAQTSWEVVGNPRLQPGQIVMLASASLGVEVSLEWVMQVNHDIDDRGFITTLTTWAGAGEALAAGDDCVTEAVGSGVYHLGNQTISWYAAPASLGESETIPFTVTNADYSSLRLSGLAHGTNTYGTGNTANPTTGSLVEVWQLQDPSAAEGPGNELRRAGSMELPTLDEEYARRRPYGTSDEWWTSFNLPMPGNLREGPAELRLLAGSNPDGRDDYEVKQLELTYCGVGLPTLPDQVV